MSITCIHGLEAPACNRCKPATPRRRTAKPRLAKQLPTTTNLFDAEAQARIERAMLAARQAAHAGTLLSKQLGKQPKQLSPIEVATNG